MRGRAGARVALYARCFSDKQSDSSIERQLRRCREYVAENGGDPAEAVEFVDRATSGASLARPGWEALTHALNDRTVDTIVTEDVSRISRDFADAATVLRDLQYRDVVLLSVADGIDTSSRQAKLTYGMKTLMAEAYLDDLRDKTRGGMKGEPLRGPSTGGLPFGYVSKPVIGADGRPVEIEMCVYEDNAAIVRRIFEGFAAGLSYARGARELNDDAIPGPRKSSRGWLAGTVRELLRSEMYVGVRTFGKRERRRLPGTNSRRYRERPADSSTRIQQPELRIIPAALWEQVQARLRDNMKRYGPNRKSKSQPGRYLRSGILRCGLCGNPMIIAGGTPRRYACGDNHKGRKCQNRAYVHEEVARQSATS